MKNKTHQKHNALCTALKTFQTLDLYLSSIHFGGNNEQNDGKSELCKSESGGREEQV